MVRGSLHLHGGDIDITNAEVVTDAIRVLVNADFVDFPHRDGATANISITGDDIGQFRQLIGLPGLPERPFQLNLALDGDAGQVTASLKVGDHRLAAVAGLHPYLSNDAAARPAAPAPAAGEEPS